MKLFKELENQLDRKLTDSDKTLALMAYTIGKNDHKIESGKKELK